MITFFCNDVKSRCLPMYTVPPRLQKDADVAQSIPSITTITKGHT